MPSEAKLRLRQGAADAPGMPGRDVGRPRRRATTVGDRFFRDMVASMRNGVLAVTRDGGVAVMNDEAYRIFGLTPDAADIGRPYADVLRVHPDMVRVIASTFELSHLPNRVELRLKSTGRVIGYTLAHIRDEAGEVAGAALFFKDLTRVEQLEERERLRDRLAALGEMAAAMAHELKNPLAGIEVMAGLLRRKVSDSPDAQSILNDIINEAKMANSTVVEMLDYVRPVRLERGRTVLGPVLQTAVSMAESKAQRGEVGVEVDVPRRPAADPGRRTPAVSGVHQPGDQRVRGARRRRDGARQRHHRRDGRRARTPGRARRGDPGPRPDRRDTGRRRRTGDSA